VLHLITEARDNGFQRLKSGIYLEAKDPESSEILVCLQFDFVIVQEVPSGEIEARFTTAREIRLRWQQPPQRMLIVQKRGDPVSSERLELCARLRFMHGN